ncbi:hypothetical protein Mapa_001837 [Marchantia paleacea]|nr:hypothetical protein Mapa_001837 [Marchantia paleacea]
MGAILLNSCCLFSISASSYSPAEEPGFNGSLVTAFTGHPALEFRLRFAADAPIHQAGLSVSKPFQLEEK